MKSADDTKIFRKISNTSDTRLLQEDLDTLVQWSKKWKMTFNMEKCKVMHIGKQNEQKANYYVQGCELKECEEEKDLGLLISSDPAVISQCNKTFVRPTGW